MNKLKKISLSLIIVLVSTSCSGQETNLNKEEPLVCKMTGAQQAEAKEIAQKEVFSQVKRVEEVKTGYIFYFKYDEDFLIKMTDYVIAENNCCPFFTFNIKIHSKEDVSLKITGSSEAKEMLKMTFIDKK